MVKCPKCHMILDSGIENCLNCNEPLKNAEPIPDEPQDTGDYEFYQPDPGSPNAMEDEKFLSESHITAASNSTLDGKKNAASRYMDDEWREILEANGYHPSTENNPGSPNGEVWRNPDTDIHVIIGVNEDREPYFQIITPDHPITTGYDSDVLKDMIQNEDEPGFADKGGEQLDVDYNEKITPEDKDFLRQMKIIGKQKTFSGKFAGISPRFSFAVPIEAGGKVAFHLAKAGMDDFEVDTYEGDGASIFIFPNEPELHVAEEIVRAEFTEQISAAVNADQSGGKISEEKSVWALWSPVATHKYEYPESKHTTPLMSSEKTADDPNSYMRGKQFSGPQLVPSRYKAALEQALSGLDALTEIGPSVDIKGCAEMSAADLRQFANDWAAGKPRFAAEKIAGQWGERSYDRDSVHDLLDQFRTQGDDTQGFDEPVPDENLPAFLENLETGQNSDDAYLGSIVFMVNQGSKIPAIYRQRAKQIAEALLADENYLSTWSNPDLRKAELGKEIDILAGDSTNAGKYRRAKFLAIGKELGLDINKYASDWDSASAYKQDDYMHEVQAMAQEDRKFGSHYRQKITSGAALSFPTFSRWFNQLKEMGDLNNFTVTIGNGAIRANYKGKPFAYLGFPLEQLEEIIGPVRRFLEKETDQQDEAIWEAVRNQDSSKWK